MNARNAKRLRREIARLGKTEAAAKVVASSGIEHCVSVASYQCSVPTPEAYERGRAKRKNGQIIICDQPNLTLQEALNRRALLHGMPPLGSKLISDHGIEWVVADYSFHYVPTTFARYPGDCDFLAEVVPLNFSERLTAFFVETDLCTSKRIVFIDTMPKVHPFGIGQGIHCATFGGDPAESYIFLDLARAHETIIAHELAHLWLIYVQDGDDTRMFKHESNHGKVNQLDFLQSFVLDLKVNDLIASREFDMLVISSDQMDSLATLMQAITHGYRPPTLREALLNSMTIAAAILERKRWPDAMSERLASLLQFFASATPSIYDTAQELVSIIRRNGYDTRDEIRKSLDECIALGFRFTEDDFDLERDLKADPLIECMLDKHPEQLVGMPVELKLATARALAFHGVSGSNLSISFIENSEAVQLFANDFTSGKQIGPFPVKYVLDRPQKSGTTLGDPRPKGTRGMVGGRVPDTYGRLPGDPGYNSCFAPGQDPLGKLADGQTNLLNGKIRDGYVRLPGDNGSNTTYLPGTNPLTQTAALGAGEQPLQPWEWHRIQVRLNQATPQDGPIGHRQSARVSLELPLCSHSFGTELLPQHQTQILPHAPDAGLARRYMAGLGLSVARSRLAERLALFDSAYGYAFGNPTSYTDPSGRSPLVSKPKPTPCISLLGGYVPPYAVGPYLKCLRELENGASPIEVANCLDSLPNNAGSQLSDAVCKFLGCMSTASSGHPRINPCSVDAHSLECCEGNQMADICGCVVKYHSNVGLGACLELARIREISCFSPGEDSSD